MSEAGHDVTQLLIAWKDGNRDALDQLMPLVYTELRRLAAYYLRRERSDHTLAPTALVHEAYLKLVDQNRIQWQSRAQFFGVASQMIRRILVDHARGHQAQKRGAGAITLTLDEALGVADGKNIDLIALDDALEALAKIDPQQSRIVEMRFFGGLSIEETAEVVGVSPATVKREWVVARAFLFREMTRGAR